MNTAQAQTKAFSSIAKLPIEKVQEMAIQLSNNFQDGADNAFEWVIQYLEEVMDESDFVNFCENNL